MTNQAAWLTAAKAHPLKVDAAPDPKAGPGEVVIKNAAVAVNPVDWKMQAYDFLVKQYPTILGTDVAGEVDSVGEGVTNVKPGQRVIGHCTSLTTGEAKHTAFQLYTVTSAIVVSPIPDSLSYEQAVVLPLGISTASELLFGKDLKMPYPTVSSKPTGKTVFVYGGSSSMGSTAIQLAVAAGATVVSVASSRNIDYVKSLGAQHVFDYSKPSVVDDIVGVLKGTEFYGVADCIGGPEPVAIWCKVLAKLGGGKYSSVDPTLQGIPEDVKPNGGSVYAVDVAFGHKEIGDNVWQKFLPEALSKGKFQAKPDPVVYSGGLSKIQEAVDELKKGVSRSKLVVKL